MSEALLDADEIRARFARAMSDMYRAEVPQYGTLLALVEEVNDAVLARDPIMAAYFRGTGQLARVAAERHGAIRVGTAAELALVARAFAVMGMVAVDYYDLAPAGLPVHSTAFRPLEPDALRRAPFRMFTSLLRTDLIADAAVRTAAEDILSRRRIVSPEALRLIERAEAAGGLAGDDADRFVAAIAETFRWHGEATVSAGDYRRLLATHRLVADIVSFRGPHINHLTPRTLDIDAAHALMPSRGMSPKDGIEGPPPRRCPLLLRQTSFKALEEPIIFPGADGPVAGSHIARFGEIEQRGAALTPGGRRHYDAWVTKGEDSAIPGLPDDWEQLRALGLCYFRYTATAKGRDAAAAGAQFPDDFEALIASGHVTAHPITYEDFLPVSAAGIFRSNLADQPRETYEAADSRDAFVAALGHEPRDPFALYEQEQAASVAETRARLGITAG